MPVAKKAASRPKTSKPKASKSRSAKAKAASASKSARQPRAPKARAKATRPAAAKPAALAWEPVPPSSLQPAPQAGPSIVPSETTASGWMVVRPEAAVPAPPSVARTTRSTESLTSTLLALLACTVGLSALTFLLTLAIPDWTRISPPSSIDAAKTLLGFLSTGVGIATVVVVCIWLHRTLANARARHPAADIQPGWAVGSFFIPFVHIVLPFPEVRKAWKADVSDDARPVAWWFVPWSLSIVAAYVGVVFAIILAIQAFDILSQMEDASREEIEAQADDLVEQMRPYSLVSSGVGLVLTALAALFLARMAKQWSAHQEGKPLPLSPAS